MALKPVGPKAFELIAGNSALDFVNTLDDRFSEHGPVELLTTYEDLLRFVSQAQLISDRQFHKLRKLNPSQEQQSAALSQAIQLREAVAAITYSLLDQQKFPDIALSILETIFKQSSAHQKLAPVQIGKSDPTRSDPLPALAWQFKGIGRDIHSPLWLLAQSASDLLTSPQASQIRKCASPTCQWLFLDTSKNHTRRWCNMKICGNRNKARLFHLRQAAV